MWKILYIFGIFRPNGLKIQSNLEKIQFFLNYSEFICFFRHFFELICCVFEKAARMRTNSEKIQRNFSARDRQYNALSFSQFSKLQTLFSRNKIFSICVHINSKNNWPVTFKIGLRSLYVITENINSLLR